MKIMEAGKNTLKTTALFKNFKLISKKRKKWRFVYFEIYVYVSIMVSVTACGLSLSLAVLWSQYFSLFYKIKGIKRTASEEAFIEIWTCFIFQIEIEINCSKTKIVTFSTS